MNSAIDGLKLVAAISYEKVATLSKYGRRVGGQFI